MEVQIGYFSSQLFSQMNYLFLDCNIQGAFEQGLEHLNRYFHTMKEEEKAQLLGLLAKCT